MNKRIASFLMIIVFLFSLCGCDTKNIPYTSNKKNHIKISDSAVEQETDIFDNKSREYIGNIFDNASVRIHFIDVGQADCTFIELANGQTMLIDAGHGSNADAIISYIKNLKYETIDYVVATHPHDDHIGGMATVLSNFNIGRMYMPKQPHTINAFTDMLNVIERKRIDLYTAKAGVSVLSDGIVDIDILAPFSNSGMNLNNASAVIRITYGETVMLFMGDAEQDIEKQLLNSIIDADVLKVGHHGSDSSSSIEFIKAVSPDVAIISVGKGNSYGHPHPDTLKSLTDVGAKIYRTDNQGTIVVVAERNKKITVDKKSSTVKENAPPDSKQPLSEERQTSVLENDSKSYIVYITRTGKKYHRLECSYLISKIETTLEDALAMGLEDCSVCRPPKGD